VPTEKVVGGKKWKLFNKRTNKKHLSRVNGQQSKTNGEGKKENTPIRGGVLIESPTCEKKKEKPEGLRLLSGVERVTKKQT